MTSELTSVVSAGEPHGQQIGVRTLTTAPYGVHDEFLYLEEAV